jgi:hypothetical protein
VVRCNRNIKEESRETFWRRRIATLKIGRRCPLDSIITPASSSRTQYASRKEHKKEREHKHMTDVLTATDYEVPGPGQHRVEIQEVQKRDGKFGPYYRIGTKIVGGEFDGLWVSFVASAKLTPAAKLRIAIEDILDKKLRKGEKFNPQELVGREAVAEVSNKTEDERTYANIEQFFPLREDGTDPREAQSAASVAAAAPPGGAGDADGYVEGEDEPMPEWD